MAYTADYLGVDFVKQTIALTPDREGEVCCTLVKLNGKEQFDRSVLYVHGFSDYFFQAELAREWRARGYNFYAVDLRKCGRSWLPHQTRANLYSISDYFEDLDAVVARIQAECAGPLAINAHSTGALAVLLYLSHRRGLACHALVLNSPFWEMNKGWGARKVLVPLLSACACVCPDLLLRKSLSPFYGQSISIGVHGEWAFNEVWKPLGVSGVRLSWLRAIRRAHREFRRGLGLACPVLVMHSATSFRARAWNEGFMRADAVLNVEHIRRYAHCAGGNVTIMPIDGGLHDLVLSRRAVREEVYRRMFGWLDWATADAVSARRG